MLDETSGDWNSPLGIRRDSRRSRPLARAASASLPVASLLALVMAVVVEAGFLGSRSTSLGELGRFAGILEGFAVWFLWLYPVLLGTWLWIGSGTDRRQFAQL